MVETQFRGCMKALNRRAFSRFDHRGQRVIGQSSSHGTSSAAPLLLLSRDDDLDMFVPPRGTRKAMWTLTSCVLSEIDPTWNMPTLAYFSTCRRMRFLRLTLPPVACVPSSPHRSPECRFRVFWCAVAWGLIYSGRRRTWGPRHQRRVRRRVSSPSFTVAAKCRRRRHVAAYDATFPKYMYQLALCLIRSRVG